MPNCCGDHGPIQSMSVGGWRPPCHGTPKLQLVSARDGRLWHESLKRLSARASSPRAEERSSSRAEAFRERLRKKRVASHSTGGSAYGILSNNTFSTVSWLY